VETEVEINPTWLPVVALALRDPQGRLLLQRRPLQKHHGGLWEFPGGKVESDENPRFALAREIAEELGIEIETKALVPLLLSDDGTLGQVVLLLYTCSHWRGAVVPHDGQEWGWFAPVEASALPLAPMDRDLLARLV
jgi:8-oxo-dGTP diphosphatase